MPPSTRMLSAHVSPNALLLSMNLSTRQKPPIAFALQLLSVIGHRSSNLFQQHGTQTASALLFLPVSQIHILGLAQREKLMLFVEKSRNVIVQLSTRALHQQK